MADTGWTRRDTLGGAALFALVVGLPVAVVRMTDTDETVSDRQRTMLREAAQAVIPRTTTPGAGDVGAQDFVILALAHGLDGTRAPAAGAALPVTVTRHLRRDGTLDYLDWLEWQLDANARGDFLREGPARRMAAVEAIDRAAFAETDRDAPESPWKKLKALILTAYYTSEAGASRELQYELVPGKFDPDLPFVPGSRAWSSDWTAVEFS
ncbi:twin-arginine translocation pathway signal protein [Sphingomonas sp. Leaf407]|uniref:gluconate 2-dehydrogenase subunit 3 family protein n=1 Tax=unclassified Sphingomonas TaxID=196159 RepID=UPI0006FEE2B0|nr:MULTISPECIES: gluconate 2-dehydrogenase subunit 3 family protein [unclassified Sphingomonas]KQN40884.1 twin-arginine translocation pathway signal protein [Sphingomonas sp. Leaf42]KQT30236.1 twin-arginine translocation pathway signal protein [Sphingomonas sp. Leaf407]